MYPEQKFTSVDTKVQECSPGRYVTGFRGRAGSVLDAIAPRCSTLKANGEPDKTVISNSQPYPGTGGSDFSESYCGEGTFATGIAVEAATGVPGQAGKYLIRISLMCGKLK